MIRKFLDDNFITITCSVAMAFVLGGFIWALIALPLSGANSFILHFNDIQGITSAGGIGGIVFMGMLAVLIIFMNFAIAREFEPRNRFFGRFLASLTLIVSILLFIGFVAIINVNV